MCSLSPCVPLIPSSVFSISVTIFSSDWLLFSSSLLKFSFCSSILFPSSVSILIINVLNSLSGKLFIFVLLRFFFEGVFLFFCLKQLSLSFPGGSDGKASAYNVGDPRSIPGSGRSPGEGNGNPLQYSCLKNPTDRETW